MASEIPDNVIAAAREHIAKGEMAIMTVCRAILAERERCAQIAENNDHFPQEGEFIAAAIRQDNHNET